MAELKTLIHKRGLIKGTLTRFDTYLSKLVESSSSKTKFEIETRLDDIKVILKQFQDIHSEIINVDEENSAQHEAELTKFEDDFYRLVGTAKEIVESFSMPTNSSTQSGAQCEINNQYVDIHSQSKLPPIELPTFFGEYSQWLNFKDLFSSMIDTNNSLNNIKKFQYLRASLKNEASDIISSLDLSADNYPIAWKLLQERYENTKLIVHNHVKALFELPVVSKENYTMLRQLLDTLLKHIRALKSLKQPTDSWDTLLIYLVSTKLDNSTLREWESYSASKDTLPTITEMIEFLQKKCQILETVARKTNNQPEINQSVSHQKQNPSVSHVKQNTSNHKRHYASHVATTAVSCYFCKKQHMLQSCVDFLKLSENDRFLEVKKLKLCVNCLNGSHQTASCKSRRCRICGKLHNALLHINKTSSTDNIVNNELPVSEPSTSTTTASGPIVTAHQAHVNISNVLLSTAIVEATDQKGKTNLFRVLLDSGSQSNFITQSACDSLGLKMKRINVHIAGVNSSQNQISRAVELTIKSRLNAFTSTLIFLVLPKITEDLPITNINVSKLKVPVTVTLADPEFYRSSKIDMLLGAEIFYDALCVGQLKLKQGSPTLQNTQFGWIVSGKIPQNPMISSNVSACHLSINDLNKQLQQFWEIEEVEVGPLHTKEEVQCELHFQQNHKRLHDGRYEVRLPFTKDVEQLGESQHTALRRFVLLEKRLMKNPTLRKQYNDFMQEYLDLGHMSSSFNDATSQDHYFLPHHAVIKEESLTTKLRVVFDGSSKSSTGISLNDVLMKGPTIQDELIDIVLRFRMHNFVITADIKQMYRQVQVSTEDRKYQQILWRFNENQSVQAYTLNTVTYGTTSAPFLAVRCLKQLAMDEKDNFPEAAIVVQRDFYVDDVITGARTIPEAIKLQKQLNQLLEKGQFPLRKWRTNSIQITKSIPNTDIEQSVLPLEGNETIRKLGLLWRPTTDSLSYTVPKIEESTSVTKRNILARIAQIYDPLGLIAPVITTAKLILQRLWQLQLNWDESVPLSVYTQWRTFERSLIELNDLSIPRQVMSFTHYVDIQLHGFSDASESAYGACVYIRVTDVGGNHGARLLCSKSRVAPLKRISLPRLELCAALLLTRLINKIRKALSINCHSEHLWTDSTIVLAWIAAPANTWQTFVANRVSMIQELSCGASWNHVNTKDNPADAVSRGIMPNQLLNNNLWWLGPQWLENNSQIWPKQQAHESRDNQMHYERRKVVLAVTKNTFTADMLARYSSLKKLQRVMANVLRFVNNIKNKNVRRTGPLAPEELEKSLLQLVKWTQQQAFNSDIRDLENTKSVAKQSKLLMLNPFLDETGLLRVGGRIRKSEFPYDQRHQLLLPASHVLTKLIIQEEHVSLLHAGPQAVLASMRTKFWPLSGRAAVRAVTRNCITCFKVKPTGPNVLMGDLPKNRVLVARPFSNCGVDYCGPITIRDSKGRGRVKTRKCYVAVFVCFSTKAVHIEAVTDLTTEAFLAAFRRFTSRRGVCKNIYSDNGTNFVGARNHLHDLQRFLSSQNEELKELLADKGMIWHFIPVRSPHFGGLWEASVKSLKYHLHRIVGTALLTFEELYTLLTQIEAILNSRPITPISSDPHDLLPLTPAHFLIGDSLTSPPEEQLNDVPLNQLSRWQHVQRLKNNFWKRWSTEYIGQLQQRSKWVYQTRNPEIGFMVLIRDDNLPPLKWKLGRICEVHPGDDNVVRVVSVKTSSGVSKLAVRKVCLLPEQLENDQSKRDV